MVSHFRPIFTSCAESTAADKQQELGIHAVLHEIFELLEEFAPTWYTEARRDRIVAALSSGSESDRTNS